MPSSLHSPNMRYMPRNKISNAIKIECWEFSLVNPGIETIEGELPTPTINGWRWSLNWKEAQCSFGSSSMWFHVKSHPDLRLSAFNGHHPPFSLVHMLRVIQLGTVARNFWIPLLLCLYSADILFKCYLQFGICSKSVYRDIDWSTLMWLENLEKVNRVHFHSL